VSRDNIGSIMPAGLVDGLTGVPRRNLFAFLGEIGKPGPFDASKGNVARLWVFDDQPPAPSPSPPPPRRSTRSSTASCPKEFNPGRLYATARLTAAAATSKPLLLTGVKAAWLDGKALDLEVRRVRRADPRGRPLAHGGGRRQCSLLQGAVRRRQLPGRLMPCFALSLLALLLVGCGGSSAPAVSPEALRQQAATSRADGRTDEAATLLAEAVRAQPTADRDQRTAAADLRPRARLFAHRRRRPSRRGEALS
jgi:hypothetical protein